MADVALVTSATLMAISATGVEGHGGMGLWGPAVFTIPLLAAWYSYEHLEVIRRTYDQTIRALGAAPELGGMVRDGHAERVAELTVAIGSQRSGSPATSSGSSRPPRCCTTSGQVCLDEPEDGRPPEPVSVAEAGATILRGTQLLAPAGDIIAAEWMPLPAERVVTTVGHVGADPEGRERVRRAVRRSRRPGRPRARGAVLGAGVPLRRGVCSPPLELVLDRQGLLDDQLV